MSDDLISRSTAMELIESKFVDGCLMQADKTLIDGYGLLDEVSDLPTAYDVGKVKRQLIDETADTSKKYREAIYKSIEIVKAGVENE